MDTCVFCGIVAAKSSTKITEDWLHTIVFEPLNPVTPGHMLVVPKRHVSDFADDPITSGYTMLRAAEYAKAAGGDFNLITSKGTAATQTVFHLHVHLVPRREGDGLALPWTGQRDKQSEGRCVSCGSSTTLSCDQVHPEYDTYHPGGHPRPYDGPVGA